MKEIGFPLKYDRQLNTYYYEEDGGMTECLFVKKGEILSEDEIKDIIGGRDSTEICFSKYKVFEVCEK
jgi:hypothetical protein